MIEYVTKLSAISQEAYVATNLRQSTTVQETKTNQYAQDLWRGHHAPNSSIIVQLKTHPVMNLIIFQCNMILENAVPFLIQDKSGLKTRIRTSQQGEIVYIRCNLMWKFWLQTCNRILSARVPVCAAISFFRSPTVSSGLHFTLTFLPNLRFHKMKKKLNSNHWKVVYECQCHLI